MTTFSHDPFSRTTIERENSYHYGTRQCHWCGNRGKEMKDGRYRLYRYTSHNDGNLRQPSFGPRLFCSIGCYHAFHS